MSTHSFNPTDEDRLYAKKFLLSLRENPESCEFSEAPDVFRSSLEELLKCFSKGHIILLSEEKKELTTQEAARTLRVSRPFLIKLLDQGKIPYRKVGAHRRIRLDDIEEYKNIHKAKAKKILNKLTTEAQDLGIGY